MEGRRGRLLLLLLLVGFVGALPTEHTPSLGEAENHVEDEYLENALENWLDNFDTYTFMVKQDLDNTHHLQDVEEEVGGEEEEEESEEPEEEGEEGEVGESWNAPIAVILDEHGLLNPHIDYQLLVESLVAEAGSIFVTLSKYQNKSHCGVGGLTKENPATVHDHDGQRLAIGEEHNETIINFDLQASINYSYSESRSEWSELSSEYWWASGHLESGGVLSLSFTPPECGCLTLSTYYALPVGNLTLVVGPQAYPSELQMLLCVDRLAPFEDLADYDDDDNEDEHNMEESDYMDGEEAAETQALVARQESSAGSGNSEGGEGGAHIVSGRSTRLESRNERKEAKRLAKKKKRQQKRQRIRQAGRRQARKQERNNRRNNRRGNRRPRNNGRQAKKAWKKLRRQNKRKQRMNRRRNHHAVLEGETSNINSTEGEQEGGHNITSHQAEENLINLLLREAIVGNLTEGEHEFEASEREDCGGEECGGEADGIGEAEEEAGGEEAEEEGATGKRAWRRKNRRQRKKLKRREKKKGNHSPGVKFCCKQGVKHKKYILTFNSTTEEHLNPPFCNSSNDIVTTFANHQFSIPQDECANTFHTCCHNFSAEMWDIIKAKKAERKMKRKQHRKARKQQRKLNRKQRKKNRKTHRRQERQHRRQGEEGEGMGRVVQE